jgi:hypothetical protein
VSFSQQPPKQPTASQSKNPSKKILDSFRESFVSTGKQGGGAKVLKEVFDTVTRETCISTSLNLNNLRKEAVLHLASCSLQVLIGFS